MSFADILTKAVSGPLLLRLMGDQGFHFPEGRAKLGFDTERLESVAPVWT